MTGSLGFGDEEVDVGIGSEIGLYRAIVGDVVAPIEIG